MTDAASADGRLGVLRARVDAEASRLARRHAERLHCRRGCADCCVDGLTVFAVEADRIRRNHAELLERGKPHPASRCAFLDGDGACRIYEDRPYVCRTQGLPLRWLETVDGTAEAVEYRDICPLNAEGEPLEKLAQEECWTIGPVEGELAALQHETTGDRRRVALRALFRRR